MAQLLVSDFFYHKLSDKNMDNNKKNKQFEKLNSTHPYEIVI